ncbi:MAG: UDP-3-O-(3-hydroxymyristoyl)glucosamine N-acyltransferase [Flavobacteriales bacterium]
MEFTAQQIAAMLNGTIEGDAQAKVNTVAKIEEGHAGALSFLANPLYTQYIYDCGSSVVLVNKDFQAERAVKPTLIRVENAYEAFAGLLEQYDKIKRQRSGSEGPNFIGKNSTHGENIYLGAFASVGNNVKIGKNVQLHAQVSIGDNCVIGDNTIVYSGAKVYEGCVVGSHCILHAGVVVGSDGFGFSPNSENNYKKVPQIGNVVVEDHVEIGANTTIDRATMGSTIIRKGVKLDNLVQIAHNVEIGENTVIAGQTGVAGSTKIGRNCMIGGQVGIVGHLTIADGVKIAAQSGVGHSITKEGSIVQGSPAFDIADYRRSYVVFRNLPELSKKISDLEKGNS